MAFAPRLGQWLWEEENMTASTNTDKNKYEMNCIDLKNLNLYTIKTLEEVYFKIQVELQERSIGNNPDQREFNDNNQEVS